MNMCIYIERERERERSHRRVTNKGQLTSTALPIHEDHASSKAGPVRHVALPVFSQGPIPAERNPKGNRRLQILQYLIVAGMPRFKRKAVCTALPTQPLQEAKSSTTDDLLQINISQPSNFPHPEPKSEMPKPGGPREAPAKQPHGHRSAFTGLLLFDSDGVSLWNRAI